MEPIKKRFYGVQRNYSASDLGLAIDYSIETVDPTAIHHPEELSPRFWRNFSFETGGGSVVEDTLANNAAWKIFSPRVAEILRGCRNSGDVRLLPLPATATSLDRRLNRYCVLGVKIRLACLDVEHSDLAWGSIVPGKDYISALYRGILDASAIPTHCDVFFIAECPGFPVFSESLARRIAELRPTGLVYEEFEAC